jgi:hypothetical protein
MLYALRMLRERAELLSSLIVDEADGLPSSSAYRSRFGSLLRAYQLVGYAPRRDYRYLEINRVLRALYPSVLSEIKEGLRLKGCSLFEDPTTEFIAINDLRSYAAAARDLGLSDRHERGRWRNTEPRIRISRPADESARCKASTAPGQRKDFSQCMQPFTTSSTSNAISLQQERTEPFARRLWIHGARQSRSAENMRDAGFPRSSFDNVTAPVRSVGALHVAQGFALRPSAIMIVAARQVSLSWLISFPFRGAGEAHLAAEAIRGGPTAIVRIRDAPVERGAALARLFIDVVIDRDHIRRQRQRRSRHHGLACRRRHNSDAQAQ